MARLASLTLVGMLASCSLGAHNLDVQFIEPDPALVVSFADTDAPKHVGNEGVDYLCVHERPKDGQQRSVCVDYQGSCDTEGIPDEACAVLAPYFSEANILFNMPLLVSRTSEKSGPLQDYGSRIIEAVRHYF